MDNGDEIKTNEDGAGEETASELAAAVEAFLAAIEEGKAAVAESPLLAAIEEGKAAVAESPLLAAIEELKAAALSPSISEIVAASTPSLKEEATPAQDGQQKEEPHAPAKPDNGRRQVKHAPKGPRSVNTIGGRMAAARKAAGLTQREVSDRAGLAKNRLSNIEGDKCRNNLDELLMLLDIYREAAPAQAGPVFEPSHILGLLDGPEVDILLHYRMLTPTAQKLIIKVITIMVNSG